MEALSSPSSGQLAMSSCSRFSMLLALGTCMLAAALYHLNNTDMWYVFRDPCRTNADPGHSVIRIVA